MSCRIPVLNKDEMDIGRLRWTDLGHKHAYPSFSNRCRKCTASRLHPKPLIPQLKPFTLNPPHQSQRGMRAEPPTTRPSSNLDGSQSPASNTATAWGADAGVKSMGGGDSRVSSAKRREREVAKGGSDATPPSATGASASQHSWGGAEGEGGSGSGGWGSAGVELRAATAPPKEVEEVYRSGGDVARPGTGEGGGIIGGLNGEHISLDHHGLCHCRRALPQQ